MPRALAGTAPRTPALVEYWEPGIGPGQVRLRSFTSVVKRDTKLRGYRADARDATVPFDRSLRLHLPAERRNAFPLPFCHQAVARVVEAPRGSNGSGRATSCSGRCRSPRPTRSPRTGCSRSPRAPLRRRCCAGTRLRWRSAAYTTRASVSATACWSPALARSG